MPPSSSPSARSGVTAVALAFLIWGLLPLYLQPLGGMAALTIAAWRYVMGCITVLAWLALRGELHDIARTLAQPALLARLSVTAALLAVNWTLYAWGVTHQQVLLTSLGYFINPLVNILLGIVVLSERLNRWQWLAVSIATAAVMVLTFHGDQVPWLALALAVTFSLYGLLRKTSAVAPLTGLACETLLAIPLALGFLLFWHDGLTPIWPDALLTQLLLLASGIVTIVPLALFNFGVHRIRYSTVGVLQYIGPSLQFATGYFVYHEPLSQERLLCFAGIWLALIIYAVDGFRSSRTAAPAT